MANMNVCKLLVWRQAGTREAGRMVPYTATDISPDMSFLEMLDVVNEGLIAKGETPIVFDSDCREGICGMCSLVVNGVPHGPDRGSTVCQLHMRRFKDGDTITIEPWRAAAFPVQRDLVVDRGAFDRAHRVGRLRVGQHRQRAGRQRDPVPKASGRGARWTRRPASAAAPAWPPARTRRPRCSWAPRSRTSRCCRRAIPSARRRVRAMVQLMDDLGFGNCSNEAECEAVCPKEISIANIARMRREYLRSWSPASPLWGLGPRRLLKGNVAPT